MDSNLLQKALAASKKGTKYAFATIVEASGKGTPRKAGSKMLVFEDGTIWGTIGGGKNEKAAQNECLKAIKSGKTTLIAYKLFGEKGQPICGGEIKVFIEPFLPQKHLIICGAGHIALPLSIHSKILDYKTTIIDTRKEFANKKRFVHADKIIVGDYRKILKNLTVDQNTLIIIITPGHEFDYVCLKSVIKSKASYIGVIASHTKRLKFINKLKQEGIATKFIKRVKIPAGIDIGAQTPEEIATSIIAEIIKINHLDKLNTAKFMAKNKVVRRASLAHHFLEKR